MTEQQSATLLQPLQQRFRAEQRFLDLESPDWEPLVALVGDELAPWFLWMGAIRLSDGALVHLYKHEITRAYVHVAKDGRTFYYDWAGVELGHECDYVQHSRVEAIGQVFRDWPQLSAFDAVRHYPLMDAALARAAVGARFWVDPAALEGLGRPQVVREQAGVGARPTTVQRACAA